MENKKPLVKKITKVLIFSLCCILLCTPTLTAFATLDDAGWSENGITLNVISTVMRPSLENVIDDWEVFTSSAMQTGYPLGGYYNEEWSGSSERFFEFAPLTTSSYLKLKITLPENYRLGRIVVYSKNSTYHYEATLKEGVFPPTFDVDVWIGAEVAIELEYDLTFSGGLTFWLDFDVIDRPNDPTPDDPTPDDPTPDDYPNFLEIIFSPITAMHSVVLFDTNGSAHGGEITIGLIFISVLGVWLLNAFLRYFAGG